MLNNEETKVERPAIEQLMKLGWSYLPGTALAPAAGTDEGKAERQYYRDVVLVNRLESALRRLNPWISEENLRKVMREITHPSHAGLMEYNQAIYEMLVDYLSVDQDLGKGRKGQTVKIIDFDEPANNDFLCVNQFRIDGPSGPITPDIVCFVNGLPLAVIECKSPYVVDALAQGIDQLRRYANLRNPADDEGAERLFWYNQFMVASCRDQARVGTISSSAQHYGEWKDAWPFSDADIQGLLVQPLPGDKAADDPNAISDLPAAVYDAQVSQIADESAGYGEVNSQQRLLAGMFNHENFLDLIRNFIIFEPVEGRVIKKVARYQQFRAVNKVIQRLKSGTDRKAKSGVVWHTQGSGKSLTMVMLAVKMRRDPELQKYKLVFVTDRTQLDSQLSDTFRAAQSETIYNADSVATLKELLRRDASDIVTTTIQKFQDLEGEGEGSFKNLNPSEKIVVLADEAHRTQFGSLAVTINAALPNAPKIGFTGTPLVTSQKMDQAFGGYIDQYKINEAVDDGATVRIIYEGRQVQSDVVGESLDALFEEYFRDYSDDEKREIKQKYGVERAVREAPARVRWVCIDLLKHYREKIQPDGFKAMIVVGSRYAATLFKKTLDELGAPRAEVIISGRHNEEAIYRPYTNPARHREIIKNFVKPLGTGEGQDPTAFLIVKDMLLTGFDAPIVQVMYIDRSLKEHTLMQAIARVNRIYKGKSAGFVVDYHGLTDELTQALEMFSSEDVEGAYHTLKDEIPRLKAAHTRVAAIFQGLKSRDIDDYVLYLKDEDRRQQFDIAFKRFAKQMDIVLPDVAARPFIPDLRLWGKVQDAACRRLRDEGLSLKDAGAKVRQLVEEHIISTGVDPKIPPIDLLAADFKQNLEKIKSPESRASEIESAIKHHITVNLDEDPEYYKSLSLRLKEIIEKTNGRWEKQLELLLELRSNIEVEREQIAEDLGLSDTELAFYNILMAEVMRHLGEETISEAVHDEIKAMTKHLVAMFDEATQIVDFFKKHDEVKRMKREIKRAILDSSFKDSAIVKSVQDRFIELAQTRFREH